MSARVLPSAPGLAGPARQTRTARVLADVLAGVLQARAVPLDAHFFDELGADSLVMAQFCARLRRHGGLPPVSMRDIYAHPTLRRLAAALASPARAAARPAAAAPPATPVRAAEHLLCGALQALFYVGYTWLGVIAATAGYRWCVADAEGLERVVRLMLGGGAAFLAVCAVPIAAKWLLIGRWRPQHIRLWSLAYVRFWVVKTLLWTNPGVHLFVGSPLYGLYLRALGARIGPRVLILSRRIPVCTDLLAIGAGSVIRREASFFGYRAEAGRIETGAVRLGRDTLVGEMSVLDIDTAMGDGAQLAHASALLSGQAVPAGERWLGSPARRADNAPDARPAPAPCSQLHRSAYAACTLLGVVFLWAPLLESGLGLLFVGVSAAVGALAPGLPLLHGVVIEAAVFSAVLFMGALGTGLLATGLVPRTLGRLIEPDRVYPLYGLHYAVHRLVSGVGRLRFFPVLFGDSNYIVHFLRWAGFQLEPVEQTGSNFGTEVKAVHPLLTAVGTGTMVADGLSLVNDELSSTSFRVRRTAIGTRNFVGNYVNYPAGGRTGDNCLLAIKVMVPLDGPVREGVGLLGSPPFEIPRSVERDSRFDPLRRGEALERGLAAKRRFNLRTLAIFLLTRGFGVFLAVLIDLAAIEFAGGLLAHFLMAALFALSAIAAVLYFAFVERCCEAIGPAPPPICSIYDPRFWWVERVWKLHPIGLLHLFDGTPFKSLVWRLMGVRVGRRVFDDGVHISEPRLTTIGDECVLNPHSKIQCDSQEDGTYKSGSTALGAGCTLGVGAFVHYGVHMGDGVVLAADAFLMKGEEVPPRSRWAGNPARGS
jgi:non-ribosomal peptide synthetase-like protein